MSKFSLTTRSNDCPVCGDISGKCRTKNDGGQEFVLCMTNGDAKLFDIIDGWKCVKPGKKGWATFTIDSAQPQINYEERQQRRAQRDAEEKAVYQAGLSIGDRDAAYSTILSQLPLHDADRADLERRGLSDATIATFASIKPWQQLSEPVSDRTPGSNGQKLLSKYSGYLVPAHNIEGQIIGFQIRNRNGGGDAPKYPWLSTQSRPANLQGGELPITYAPGEGGAVNFCEGLLKPTVAAEIHGVRFIGAAGGNFASSPQQLSEYLAKLNPETVVLCPDGGAVANRQVMQQYRLVAELVESLGYSFSVRWWGQLTKADGDVDEISREQFEQSDLVSWAEFEGKAPSPTQPAERAKASRRRIGPAAQANDRIIKIRAARQRLIDRLNNDVLIPFRKDRDATIKSIREVCNEIIANGGDVKAARNDRNAKIAAVRENHNQSVESNYKPQLEKLKARANAAIEKAKGIRDARPEIEAKAEKAASRLLHQAERERELWAPVAQEIDSTFAKTDDIDGDIQRAKQIVYASTTAGVEYDQDIKNTGGAFDEATLESLMQFTAPVIVGGETGGGKTELATQLAAYATQQNGDLTYGAIAPTQVLSVQVAERFEQKGLPMESTVILGKSEGKSESKKPKVLPAESLWKTKGKPLDFLAADEPDQWVPRVLTGILGDAADTNLAVLRDLARKTPHQLWLNADPNPITADLIGELSGRQPIIVDLQRQQDKKPVSVDWYRDGLNDRGLPILGSGQLYQDFIDSACRREKALLLAGSVKKARAIRNQLRKHGIKVQLKDGKYTPKKQRLGFALAPEKAMQPYDVVILTRLVETGLDIQKDFDAIYVALSPKMQARSAYQFLSRSRSLLRGDTAKLCIYSPNNSLTGIDQLSPQYWEDRLRKDNKTYTGLLKGDTSRVSTKLNAIEWAIDYQARYKADSARQTFFRNELLRAKFKELGWKIDNVISPDGISPITDILKKEVFKAEWTEAKCTARGHRSILEYSEAYAAKISDPNQQGLILDCKRRKLELSSLLPGSDLEDVELIFQLNQDERLLPQTLLWSAIAIDPRSERIQKLLTFLNSAHIEKFELYGALEGLKNLRKSKSMLALALAEILAGDPCLERVRKGDDVIHKYQADTQQLAAKLNENSNLINTWCRRHFGREFAWSEDCVSVVCKALDKLLGVKSAPTGQTTEKAKGKKARSRNYRTAFSAEGQAAIAKDLDKESDEVLLDYIRRFGLMESAQQGWQKKVEEAESYIQQRCGGLHTKTNSLESGTDFSVQATRLPDGANPDWVAFEQALIGAKTLAELETIKKATPEDLRVGVMSVWKLDGRYEKLKQKVDRLKSLQAR